MESPDRTPPPLSGDERTMLAAYLQYQRETLAWKCSGLGADQLREQAVPPSQISLLGLVRHMADVERGWFRNVVNGEDTADLWAGTTGHYRDFEVADADVDEAFDAWHRACARSREIVAAAPSLDVTGRADDGKDYSLRNVLLHMIEEYARHNGHADLIRERIDGATGE
ncbi:DinB family protein [Actinomadura macrotermitis]|uniref:Mini-circle protein n=1 Tax=Actinomadura macrotermitis TaxID=2585200 RepID=A0A7K0BVU6_9ACTN|nr:DinB family protein [Actinomadura macrotermitis]MQY05196.1 hypothetical protein [Actinomadura macrotermitis]